MSNREHARSLRPRASLLVAVLALALGATSLTGVARAGIGDPDPV